MWRGVWQSEGVQEEREEVQGSVQRGVQLCKGVRGSTVSTRKREGVRGSMMSVRKREGVQGSVRECEGVRGSTGGVHTCTLIGCCEYY